MSLEVYDVVRELKGKLLDYEAITLDLVDLQDSTFDPDLYGDEIYLFRSDKDSLVYIHDESDDTNGEVEVSDLRIILENLASRNIRRKVQAVAIEKFLSE